MKIQIISLCAAAALFAGCADTPPSDMGAAGDRDRNVLTGGPVSGTRLDELPPQVLTTLRQRAPNAEVADIDRTTVDGNVVYEISLASAGPNPKIHITADGRVLYGPGIEQYKYDENLGYW